MKVQEIVPITQNQAPGKTTNITLTFQNLSYSVKLPKDAGRETGETHRQILKNITGICPPGQLTAILGASGAGKTSLLNLLAKRIAPSKSVIVNGDLLANMRTYQPDTFPTFAAYVMQNDVLFGTLTVREAFQFVANLKYSDPAEKIEKVESSLRTLKLERCADTLIGNAMIKGISGGERKRTSIGVELVNDPYCILLDEPTSGLDSFTAFIIINLLKKLARSKNRTIAFTIHQPSSDIYTLFDRVMLLVQGQFIYQGPKDQMVGYFKNLGLECPAHSNPLDYLMGVMHHDNKKNGISDFQRLFDNYQNQIEPIVLDMVNATQAHIIEENVSQTSFTFQVGQICKRGLINLKRDKLAVRGRLVMTIFMGLFMGGVYFDVGRDKGTFVAMQSMIGVLFFLVMSNFMGALNPVMIQFPAERDVFLREENSKLYSTSAYFLGKSSVEIPFLLIFPIIQQLIMYWMVGLNDSRADIVIVNILICILLGLVGNSCGLMAGSMFKDVRSASGMLPLVIMPLVLFSGFYANQSQFMDWIGWIQYLSPMKYAFEALVQNEYTNVIFDPNNNDITQNPNPIEIYDLVLGLWPSIFILIGYIVVFRIMALLFLSLLREKQQ